MTVTSLFSIELASPWSRFPCVKYLFFGSYLSKEELRLVNIPKVAGYISTYYQIAVNPGCQFFSEQQVRHFRVTLVRYYVTAAPLPSHARALLRHRGATSGRARASLRHRGANCARASLRQRGATSGCARALLRHRGATSGRACALFISAPLPDSAHNCTSWWCPLRANCLFPGLKLENTATHLPCACVRPSVRHPPTQRRK